MASIRLLNRSVWIKVLRYPLLCRQASTSGQTFKTDLHTDNLYPGSNWNDRFTVKKSSIPSEHPSGFNGVINISELQVNIYAFRSFKNKSSNTSENKLERCYFS